MLLQLDLLPPLGHKEAIDTLGYPIASKLEDQLHLYIRVLTNTQTPAFIIQIPKNKKQYCAFKKDFTPLCLVMLSSALSGCSMAQKCVVFLFIGGKQAIDFLLDSEACFYIQFDENFAKIKILRYEKSNFLALFFAFNYFLFMSFF